MMMHPSSRRAEVNSSMGIYSTVGLDWMQLMKHIVQKNSSSVEGLAFCFSCLF